MEIVINVVLIVLYGVSIVHFLFRFMLLGACHGDPRGSLQAKMNFWYSYVFFILTSLMMMYQFNPWFIIGVIALPILVFVAVYVGVSIDERLEKAKDKK